MSEHNDRCLLPAIMEQVCNGVMELHALGYTHRALEPSHVVLNLAPLDVKVIRNRKTQPRTKNTKRFANLAPLSLSILKELNDGAQEWDILALG